MKIVLKILSGVIALALLLLVALLVVLFTIDPNSFKPNVKSKLADMNINADFTGEWSWKLYPRFQIDLGQLSVSAVYPEGDKALPNSLTERPLASTNRAYLSLDVMPLFRRKVHFNAFVLEEAELFYGVALDKSQVVRTNIDPILDALDTGEDPIAEEEIEESKANLDFAIETIQIVDSGIIYLDQTSETSMTLSRANLRFDNVQLAGNPIEVSASSFVQSNDLKPAYLAAEFNVVANEDFTLVKLSELALTISNEKRDSAKTLKLAGSADIKRQVALERLDVKANLDLSSEKLDLLLVDIGLLESAFPKPLSVGADSKIGYVSELKDNLSSSSILNFSTQSFTLNDSGGQISSTVELVGERPPKVQASVVLDKLTLAEFVEESSENKADDQNPGVDKPSSAEELPLDLLDAAALLAKIQVKEITFDKINAKNFRSAIELGSGKFAIRDTALDLADGSVGFTVTGRRKGQNLETSGDFEGSGLESAKMLSMFSDLDMISGVTNTEVKFQSLGNTSEELISNLTLDGTFGSQDMLVKGVDIVSQFCSVLDILESIPDSSADWKQLAVNQISKKFPQAENQNAEDTQAGRASAKKSGNDRTEFKPISLAFSLQGENARLDNLEASIENIKASANGRFNTKTLDFRVPFTLQVADFAKGVERCVAIPERIRQVKIPLVCRGKLDSIGPTSCVPDVSALRSSGKNYLNAIVDTKKTELKARANAKIEAEKARLDERIAKEKSELKEREDELKKRIDEKREEAENKAKEKAREKLKSLFGS